MIHRYLTPTFYEDKRHGYTPAVGDECEWAFPTRKVRADGARFWYVAPAYVVTLTKKKVGLAVQGEDGDWAPRYVAPRNVYPI